MEKPKRHAARLVCEQCHRVPREGNNRVHLMVKKDGTAPEAFLRQGVFLLLGGQKHETINGSANS